MKTIYNTELTTKNVNQKVELFGWVNRIRKLGKLTFINLRDSSGIIQLVINKNLISFEITKESVINVSGTVQLRLQPNKEMKTGKIEISVEKIQVLSLAHNLPFDIEKSLLSKEDLRLEYRYLDLRNRHMFENIYFRHQVLHHIRNFLNNKKFIEIETPMLSKSTPEGARDFLVPTRHFNKSQLFYALPQSPQLYKQLLMVSGFEKYFQITKVFRDEDSRADRQPEFTQLDIETSFSNINSIKSLIEEMMVYILRKMNFKVKIPFLVMNYDDAINNYGTDSPDISFDNLLIDVTSCFKNSQLKFFKNKQCIKMIYLEKNISNNDFIKLKEIANKNKCSQIKLINLDNNIDSNEIIKLLRKKLMKIKKNFQINKGSILLAAGNNDNVSLCLGALRTELNNLYQLSDLNKLCFLWIQNWPLFKFEDGKYTSMHHPFTSPSKKSMNSFEKESNPRSEAFDLVLNGYEIAGGSIRIHDQKIQNKVFKMLGLNDNDIKSKFGFLLNSFNYGVPPHGGIAFGLDRLIMILKKEKSIREVIAFPKNSKGLDPLSKSPSTIKSNQLSEYNIEIKKLIK